MTLNELCDIQASTDKSNLPQMRVDTYVDFEQRVRRLRVGQKVRVLGLACPFTAKRVRGGWIEY